MQPITPLLDQPVVARPRKRGTSHDAVSSDAGKVGRVASGTELDGRTRRAERVKRRRDELILDALERLLATTPLRDLGVEEIAEAAGITRTRFYSYYKSKHGAFAALLRRVAEDVIAVYDRPDSWFVRPPDVRPRDSLRPHIERVAEVWLRHAPVFREASDLWNAVPEVADHWHQIMSGFANRMGLAIERERELGVAPPGPDAQRLAEGLAWQGERLLFLVISRTDGVMSTQEVVEVGTFIWMRAIYLADDPDPVAAPAAGSARQRQKKR
jgi:AcrR family transcriptional regulator